MALFINPANRGPGVHTGPTLGASLSAIGLQWKIHEKTFFSETTTANASIFGMQNCYMELYINPAKHAPRVRNGPTPDTIHNPDKSYSADVSRVSRSHDQDGHHTDIW